MILYNTKLTKIEEKQELAGLFSELAFTAVHQLSMDKDGNSRWTPTERAMIHAAIGYLTADLAGSKTPISTALANGVNAYAVEALKKDEKLKAYFDENPALLRAVSIGIGAGIGGLTGDGNADAWSGASSAQNATRWNDLNEEKAAQHGEDPTHVNDSMFDGKRTKEEQIEDRTEEQRNDASIAFVTDENVQKVVTDATISTATFVATKNPVGAILVGGYYIYSLNKNYYDAKNGDENANMHSLIDIGSISLTKIIPNANGIISFMQFVANEGIDFSKQNHNKKGGDKK